MTDWLHSVRTDGLPLHTLCIAFTLCALCALHCIVLHCIALHYIHCIALRIYCIAYWLNVMLIVRHVCSWIVPSVTFNVLPRSDLCFLCRLSVTFFFGSGPPYGRTDLLDCMRLTELNWNNWNLSVHPWHSYILTFYIDISILARGKMTSFRVRPSVHSDFHLRVLSSKPLFCVFCKKKNDWLTSFRTDGRTSVHTLHCIALRTCITCIHCIALHCIVRVLHCIALRIAYWLNVMLIVRHVCSWIVPSVTFIFGLRQSPAIGGTSICLGLVSRFAVSFFGTEDGLTVLLRLG
jgi:hypothetical protein